MLTYPCLIFSQDFPKSQDNHNQFNPPFPQISPNIFITSIHLIPLFSPRSGRGRSHGQRRGRLGAAGERGRREDLLQRGGQRHDRAHDPRGEERVHAHIPGPDGVVGRLIYVDAMGHWTTELLGDWVKRQGLEVLLRIEDLITFLRKKRKKERKKRNRQSPIFY